jgi:hypothetical protein
MLEGSLHFPLPNPAKDEVTELDEFSISARLTPWRQKTSSNSMLED